MFFIIWAFYSYIYVFIELNCLYHNPTVTKLCLELTYVEWYKRSRGDLNYVCLTEIFITLNTILHVLFHVT